MKSFFILCFLIGFFVHARADGDDQCKDDLKNFLACVKSSSSDSDRQAKKKELEDKADQCFTKESCDTPKWDSNPLGGSGTNGMSSMPDSVKKCMKQKLMDKMAPKLNDCLTKHNVATVDWKSAADSADGAGFGMMGGSDMHEAMLAVFNAVRGVDKCCQAKKGGDTTLVKPLEQCLQDTKQGIKPKICAVVKPCEDKASATCKTRGQAVAKALCQCKKEKEADIAGKLKVLGQQQKVSIQDLIKTAMDDQDMKGIMDDLDKCYQDNNETEPPMILMAKAMVAGGTPPPGPMANAMMVNGTTCIIMSDMLTLDVNDQTECDSCP